MKKLLLLSALLLSSSLAVAAHHGMNLTDGNGMTLYTFDKDTEGKSVCYDACATKWRPFIAKEGAADKKGWGKTERKDGSQQWTYNGQPLYTWIGDKEAGDTTGDGVGGVWHIAKKGHGKKAKKKAGGYSY